MSENEEPGDMDESRSLACEKVVNFDEKAAERFSEATRNPPPPSEELRRLAREYYSGKRVQHKARPITG